MAALTTKIIGLDGVAITFADATSGGDTCETGPGVALLVKNGDASSHTVTLATPGTVRGLAIADRTVTVAAGAEEAVLVTSDYRDPSTGLASITYDGVTSVTVAVIRVPAT
jgi:hypothetical protein